MEARAFLAHSSLQHGRLREKNEFVNKAASRLINSLVRAAMTNEKVNAREIYTTFTLNVTLSVLFSLDLEEDEETFKLFKKFVPQLIRPSPWRQKLYTVCCVFPFLTPVLKAFSDNSSEASNFYTTFVARVMEERRMSSGQTYRDVLQNMINAESEIDDDMLTFKEIVSQSSLFFVAGNDSSSTALTFLSYEMVHRPDVQDKILEEIQTQLGDDEPSYDNVLKLTYLEACLQETLRLHPASVALTRKCIEDTEVNGIRIKKGTGVYLAIKNVCSDPDYYTDLERFNPNRFVKGHPEESEVPIVSFGLGPMNCFGIRFAMSQMKMVMVSVMRKVRFVSANYATMRPAVMFTNSVMSEPIMVEVEMRQ